MIELMCKRVNARSTSNVGSSDPLFPSSNSGPTVNKLKGYTWFAHEMPSFCDGANSSIIHSGVIPNVMESLAKFTKSIDSIHRHSVY
jgi:hypothetical protein